jgi:hypothetical protein
MPANYPEAVLFADHGTEEEIGSHAATAAPLSDGLISALGRLAVKEALTDAAPAESAPQVNQLDAPGFSGVSMGKPLELVKDQFYIFARCPVTREILDAIHDDAAGSGAPLTGEWRVACADCNKTHALDLSTIKSEQFTSFASQSDDIESWPE